jgi:hypothetical protein
MIEGDGYIYVPKDSIESQGKKKYSYPYCMITFHKEDLPLAKKQEAALLGYGFIMEVKGVNAYRFQIKSNKNLMDLILLINGNFRTPKILRLHAQNLRFGENRKTNFPLLPIDNSNLGSNAWFSGFSDADCSFSIRYRTNISKSPAIYTVFKLELASMHEQTGKSLNPVMAEIANYLGAQPLVVLHKK